MEDPIRKDQSAVRMRPAEVEDAEALARVHVDAWQAAYRGLVPDGFLKGFSFERRVEYFRQALAARAEEDYVVYLGETVVGVLTLGAARDPDVDVTRTGEIWGIYLVPAYWRRGIGTWLVREAERMLAERAYTSAVLWVLEGNQQARRFYEKMGFAVDGASRDIDWGTVLRAVRYRKALPAPFGC
jgi:ribosomal protein S18 acetylase RimI-like enzyme